ncbi:UDP-N-acetylglucosamine-peptide N-acetylglucosaminyltransferase [Phaeobacter porticola]|uniref:Putative O-linked N-acetylglucosamine transferase, SPINDLY family n=1 Tax=Phaeobacter porticola TaxID=1844006 RepID=A0A1L3I4B6_9RHOB|nr:UDP-N-acetylglucosamine-peptide N-acetylglucosaminyltransferase [Phaeobacter porticola]APG46974.1 putative O-linked N-acetylglucosamine transferase, SPINDLY family [Phaeobacter porticola]
MTIAFPKSFDSPMYDRAVLLMRNGEFPQAETVMRSSIEREGETALSYHYLAEIVASQSGRIQDAIKLQTKALSLAPTNSVFIAALGSRLKDGGFDRDALKMLEAALSVDPNNPIALPLIMRLRRQFLSWEDKKQEESTIQRILQNDHTFDPLALLAYTDDPQVQLNNAYARAPRSAGNSVPPHPPGEKIRVGYFSSDFHEHATMHLFEGALKAHDRDLFQFFVYDIKPREQSRQYRFIKEFADLYRDVSRLTAQEIARLAIEDKVDIAVDLKGDTTDAKQEIFAFRAAPAQVSFLGFPGTSGMAEMDYMIADNITVPKEDDQFYSEDIVRMPTCYQPNSNCRYLPKPENSRSRYGLPDDKFVFANLNNTYKVGPREFAAWMKILKRAPDSVLLFYTGMEDNSAAIFEKARALGVNPERIIPCTVVPQAEHLDRIAQVDLCLDCFSYNAHTTASDALWAGVPILTIYGKQFSARVATSILNAANLAELSVTSEKHFIDKAVSLAKDPEEMRRLKRHLDENRYALPLFDTKSWAKDFEEVLRAIYKTSQNKA